MKISSMIVLGLSLAPFVAFAHGDRPSFEREVHGYLIDVGYEHEILETGVEEAFDFDLYTGTGADIAFAPFTHIDVTFTDPRGNKEGFALKNEQSFIPTLKHTFLRKGMYQLAVRYRNDEETLAFVTFDVPVGNQSHFSPTSALSVIVVLLLISVGAVLVTRPTRAP